MSLQSLLHQKKAKDVLLRQLRAGRVAHAYLFLGPEGVGRRTAAREFAKALICSNRNPSPSAYPSCDHCASCGKIDRGNHPDVRLIDFEFQSALENKELDKQKAIKIDTIRALQREVNLKPTEGTWKIFIIDPAEKITIDAANCLLKTLEEPPPWTVIILLAQHKENLPATVVSRAQIVPFSPLPEKTIAGYLTAHHSLSAERAAEIARNSEGSLGAAVLSAEERGSEADFPFDELRNGRLTSSDILEMSQKSAKSASELIDLLLAEFKKDFRQSPRAQAAALEAILSARRYLEGNSNPQMVLDVMLLRLNRARASRAPRG